MNSCRGQYNGCICLGTFSGCSKWRGKNNRHCAVGLTIPRPPLWLKDWHTALATMTVFLVSSIQALCLSLSANVAFRSKAPPSLTSQSCLHMVSVILHFTFLLLLTITTITYYSCPPSCSLVDVTSVSNWACACHCIYAWRLAKPNTVIFFFLGNWATLYLEKIA
jgi:hypothetical protein